MSGFTKLFSSITESSVWIESDKTLRIWVAFLARADAEGFVEGSIPGMANLCMMSIDDFMAAIKPLLDPDHFSRNPENEGRRLKESPGGWLILNYRHYRERPQDKHGSAAERMRRYRARKKGVTGDVTLQENVTRYTEAEEEAEAGKKKRRFIAYGDRFLAFWKGFPGRNGRKSGKEPAWEEWQKLSPDEELEKIIFDALHKQKRHREAILAKTGFAENFPDACRWIKNRRWEDEVEEGLEVKDRWNQENSL